MKIQLALAALVLCVAPTAFAQNRGNFNGQGQGQNRGGQNAGVLPLPRGVNRVVSIDAYNILLAESQNDTGGQVYTPIIVRHVYSGGIAALFGGVSIPTAQFVSPGAMSNNGGGGAGGNRIAGGIGGNNGFGVGNGNNGFGSGGGGNTGFGFNGVSGFNGTGINNGFNGAGNGQIFQTPGGGLGIGQTSVVGPNGQQIPLANGPFFGQ